MTSEDGDDSKPVSRVELRLDLRALNELMNIGVRRAAAFLKIGSLGSSAAIPDDLSLGGGVNYQFFPNPISEEIRSSVRAEFNAWLIGSCLKELDQHFSVFLDSAWRMLEWADLSGRSVPSSEVIEFDRRFPGVTNSARKLQRLAEKIGEDMAIDGLESLSLARNALTHGVGRVRQRDCNEGDCLTVRWVSVEMVITDGSEEIVFRDQISDMHQVKAPEGAEVGIRFSKRSRPFKVGEKIELTPHELAEICMYYQQQAVDVVKRVQAHLIERGICPEAKAGGG